VPASRVHTTSDDLHVGVRPEKLHLTYASEGVQAPAGANWLDGVISDASFIGVSTQYLVDLPWGHSISVFAQNTSRDERLVLGAKVLVSWDPSHSFALDAAQRIDAGADIDHEASSIVGAPS
jgi:spermidine/putrescine transport system ATP-binding protein